MARRMQLCWDWQSQRAGLEYSLDTTVLSSKPGSELTAGHCLFICTEADTSLHLSCSSRRFAQRCPSEFPFWLLRGLLFRLPWIEVRKLDPQNSPDGMGTCAGCGLTMPSELLGGCVEQACLPDHESLPHRSSSRVSKMLPAKRFELPGTRCGTNSLIIVTNPQILGSGSGNTKKGMGLGRQKQMYLSTPGCCLLCAFPLRDTKPLLLSLGKSYAFVWEELPLLEHKCYIFFFMKQSTFVPSQQTSYPAPGCFS